MAACAGTLMQRKMIAIFFRWGLLPGKLKIPETFRGFLVYKVFILIFLNHIPPP